jgi:hypothetical protein
MKTLTLTLTALLFTCAAQAEVVIYNQVYTQTQTGQGSTTVTNLGGYFLFDDQGNMQQVDACAKTKTFTIYDYSGSYTFNYIQSGVSTSQLVYTISSGDAGAAILKGKVFPLQTGTTTFRAPKILTISGAIISGTDPDAVMFQFAGTFTYNSKATVSANVAGNDIDAAVATLKAVLVGKGYRSS